MKSRTLSLSIACPPERVYAYVRTPANLPEWLTSFCRSVRKSGDDWFIETTDGAIGIRFVPENEFGILDHSVTLPDGQEILNPMRVMANGTGSEVLFTLFQTLGMSDEQFAQDAGMVEADLRMLKSVLEK
jgi:hypothetical protein